MSFTPKSMLWEPSWSDQKKFEHACRYRWEVEIYKLAPKAGDIGQGISHILKYNRNGTRTNIVKYEKADLNLIENLAKMLTDTGSLYLVLKIFVTNDDCNRLQRFIKHMLTSTDISFKPFWNYITSEQNKTEYFQMLVGYAIQQDKVQIVKMLLDQFGNIIDPAKGTVFDIIVWTDEIIPSTEMQQFIDEYTFSLDSVNYNKNMI